MPQPFSTPIDEELQDTPVMVLLKVRDMPWLLSGVERQITNLTSNDVQTFAHLTDLQTRLFHGFKITYDILTGEKGEKDARTTQKGYGEHSH